ARGSCRDNVPALRASIERQRPAIVPGLSRNDSRGTMRRRQSYRDDEHGALAVVAVRFRKLREGNQLSACKLRDASDRIAGETVCKLSIPGRPGISVGGEPLAYGKGIAGQFLDGE